MFSDDEQRRGLKLSNSIDSYIMEILPGIRNSFNFVTDVLKQVHYRERVMRYSLMALMADTGKYELEVDVSELTNYGLSWAGEVDEDGNLKKVKLSLIFPAEKERIEEIKDEN